MDICMDVDVALAKVPVNILPLIDDADFKTIEDAVAYNAAGMALRWHFVTTAGAYTVTSVTPTTGGVHDWTDEGDAGIYTIEIPDTGGTINNTEEGHGWFTGSATGILPWRGPVIGFRAAGLNDLLIDSSYSATRGLAGTALPDAAADASGGVAISDLGGVALDTVAANVATLITRITGVIGTTEIQAAAAAALVAIHLDHLFAQNYDPTSKPGTGTALLNELIENDGGVSRFTSNALEQAPSAAGSVAMVMQSTTLTVTSQTEMVLAAGSADDDAYNDRLCVITDQTTGEQKGIVRASDYTGSTKTITFEAGAVFTVATGDGIDILAVTGLTKAEVNAQVIAAQVTHKLDHLVAVADADDPVDDSIIAKMASASGDWSTFAAADDALEAIGNTIASVAGAGANLVTITVQDTEGTPNDLENATVVLTEGGNSYTATTDVNGEAVFRLNSASYDYVIAKPNYAGTSGTIVVATNPQTETYAMAVNASPAPPAVGLSNGSLICYDEDGVAETGVIMYLQLNRGSGVAGRALDTKIRSETSPAGGLVTFAGLVKGAEYKIWRGPAPSGTGGGLTVASAGAKVPFTVPDAGTQFDISEVLGADE